MSAVTAPIAVAVEQHLRINEDPVYLDGYVRRFRGCRLALAALELDPFSPHKPSVSSPGASSSSPGVLSARRLKKLKALPDNEIADDALFSAIVQAATATLSNGVIEVPVRFTAVIDSIDRVTPEHQLYNPFKPRLYATPRTVVKAKEETPLTEEGTDLDTPILLDDTPLAPDTSSSLSYGPLEGLYGTAYGLILVLRECGVHCNPIFSKAYSVNERSNLVKQVRAELCCTFYFECVSFSSAVLLY